MRVFAGRRPGLRAGARPTSLRCNGSDVTLMRGKSATCRLRSLPFYWVFDPPRSKTSYASEGFGTVTTWLREIWLS